jgi:hypothetical protein
MLNVDGTAMSQLHQLKNGYTRPAHHTINRQSNKQSYSHMQHYQNQQQQQQQQINNFAATATPPGLAYAMQNMNMGVDMTGSGTSSGGGAVNSQKSGGSDSGGSSIGSTGDISPPETPVASMPAPTPMALRARLNLGRLTNRTPNLDKTGTSVIYAPPQSTSPHQQQLQQSSNDMPPMMGGVTSNLNYSLSNNHLQSPSHVVQATGGNHLTTNQQPQSQMMQNPQYAYHTQQQQTANAARLTTTMPPPITTNYRPQHQNVSGTPAFQQIQPNGDQLYTYPPHLTALPTPGGVLTFLPTNPPPSLPPSVLRASPSNTVQQQQSPAQQLTAGLMQPPPPTAQSGVQSTTVSSPMVVYPMLAVAGTKLSCFNCGSTQHAGTNCPEASMEDVTRIVYKLDYTINHMLPPPPSQQQLQQPPPPPPAQQILLQTVPSTDQQSLPVLPPPPTNTSTASTVVGMPRTMSSLSLKSGSSDNKPVMMDEIVDLTNLSSSSNNSSTTSLNNVGGGGGGTHK